MLREQVAVEYLNVWFRYTTHINGGKKYHELLLLRVWPVTALPISHRWRLDLCTSLSTSPPGHPGLPTTTCIYVVGLLSVPVRLFIVRLGNFRQYQFISMYFMQFPMKRLGKWNYFKHTVHIKKKKRRKKRALTKIIYTWHVNKTEAFRHPINDVILKRGKELVKTVSGKVLF